MTMEGSVPHIKMQPLTDTPFAATVGSMDINKAFELHLRNIFEAAHQRSPALGTKAMKRAIELDKSEARKEFEIHKLSFTGSANDQRVIPIPLPTLGQQTILNLGVEGGVLLLSKYVFFN